MAVAYGDDLGLLALDPVDDTIVAANDFTDVPAPELGYDAPGKWKFLKPFDGGENLKLANIPQRALAHSYPTAAATVDKNEVTMLTDNGSANAEVPLTVKNTKGFDLPKTGDHGTWMYSLVGILLMSTAAGVIVLTVKKKNGR